MPSSSPTGFLRLTEEVLGAKKLDYTTHLNKLESFTVGTMRTLILVALILKAVLAVDTDKFEFGDIISFKPRCRLGFFSYMHFAVYVGDKGFDGKKEGDNIFERLKVTSPHCPFAQLNFTDEPKVSNYLDGYKDKTGKEYKKGSDEQIMERINEKYKACGKYGPVGNNCEHLATYVRYGVKVALQFNTTAQGRCRNSRVETRDMINYVRNSTTCETNPTSD